MSCWAKHGMLTNDKMNIFINLFSIILFLIYISAFAYYQPKRVFKKFKISLEHLA